MAERRAATKSRRLGSSRRKQLREGSEEPAATAPGEEPSCPPEIVQRVQDFFRERDKDQEKYFIRSDMQKLREEGFPCSAEELELVFDGLDAAGTGRLSTEEFTAGLWQFLSSQKASRDHRRRKTASRRVRLVFPSPVLEGAESEERRHFAAFMDQLGTDNISEEQEIWQLWVNLRQDEPQLLGNLEDFLAKMRHRIQEARSKKEALEVTLNKRVAEHNKEVQQLCEVLEQQIQQEQERLEQQSVARSHQRSAELQRALEASEREVQRLVTAQMELEARCHSLRSTQRATSTENQQLEESNRVLEDHLQHLHQQLQQTQRRLWTARAAVTWEHMEEPGDRAVAELPGETPMSPQLNPEKSEKNLSEIRIRLGSQSNEPKAKSTHQVVWEMLPTETSLSGALLRVSSTEEDPFPEFLKEERFSDQSSLLREMNDAIAALSKHLKPQAPNAPLTPAATACHPQDGAEPQRGLEAATAPGTTPEVLPETVPGHVSHELLEGDWKEGPAPAELRAPDTSQAGASGLHRDQEPGAEQGESPEETGRMLFLQGMGTNVKELVLKVAEHLQGAPGESTGAGEQLLMEVEGEGWMQEKAGWEKAQPPGEAEEVALSQGEKLEAGLEPLEAGDAGGGAGQQLATDELGLAAAPGDPTRPLDAACGEEANPPSVLPEKLEIKPGESPEPEPPPRGEAQMGAAQRDEVLPEVTAAPGHGLLEEKRVGAELQPQGEALAAGVPPAQRGGSSRAQEWGTEVTQAREAEPQPQGESAKGDGAGRAASAGAEGPPLAPRAVPPTDEQGGRAGADVQPLEAPSSDADLQLLAEVEAALQPPSEAGSPGTEEGGSVAPGVQPLEEVDKLELGLGEEMGAAVVQDEGLSPAETPAGSPGLGRLLPVKAQELEMEETEDAQAGMPLGGGLSIETRQGEEGGAAVQLKEEAEDGAEGQDECELLQEPVLLPSGVAVRQGEGVGAEMQPGDEAEILDMLEEAEDGARGQDECELLQEPVLDPQGAGFGQGEVAGAGLQPAEEVEVLDTLEDQSPGANMQLLPEADEPCSEVDELKVTPGGGTETHLELLREDREQRESTAPDVQSLDQVDQPALEELEAGGSWADTQLQEGPSLDTSQGEGDRGATRLREEAEDGTQGQDEPELLQESVLDGQGAGFGQGEGAGAEVQPPDEAEILDTLEDQSTEANMQLLAEMDELDVTPDGNTQTDLQLSTEGGSLDREEAGSVAPDVQPLDQPELVTPEAEGAQADTQLRGGLSPEAPWEGEGEVAVQLREEAEDGAQGQDECELLQEPVLNLQGAGFGQGEVAVAGLQPLEEAEILEMLENQSPDANMQLLPEADEPHSEVAELKVTPGGGIETHLELLREDREQRESTAPDVQSLDQVDQPALEELEAGSSWADKQLQEGPSLDTSQGEGDRGATRLREEAEDGTQGQDEPELLQESVLDGQGAGFGQGEGAGAGMQPLEEVEILDMLEEAEDGAQGQDECELLQEPVLDLQGAGFGQGEVAGAGLQPLEEVRILETLEDQRPSANVQLLAEMEELELTPGGIREADPLLLGAAGMREGEQSQSLDSEAARSTGTWEGAAGAPESTPVEATLHVEVAVVEGPGVKAELGALASSTGQILEDTQTLERERVAAEEMPLDGAEGLEAGVRSSVETQSPGMKQGHDDGESVLAPPGSKVTLQTSRQRLGTLMQEDVLVPDVLRLGAPGQAAQSELQEQVSAQADEMRLHTASQQPKKPPRVMEEEQVAAGPAEHPKPEVPPASAFHTSVQQEEDARNGLSGMVLGDGSVGDAANSSVQPQGQLLGEQSEDLGVGQQEKQQEVGQKASQESEPSPGEPGAVTAGGAGAAPRGSPEASLEPDHLYNVLFVGDSHVGKTSFLYRLQANTFNPHLIATLGLDYQIKNLIVDNKRFALRLWDSAGQERYHSITKQFFRKADGVVLMYDVTSEYSFADVRYWLSCIQEGAEDGVTVLLLGNKTDCAAERQVPTTEGERLAKEHQLVFYECSAASGHNVSESMVSLVRLLKVREDELKNKAEEMPEPAQKKKGCC